jgi:hypothetical protein
MQRVQERNIASIDKEVLTAETRERRWAVDIGQRKRENACRGMARVGTD